VIVRSCSTYNYPTHGTPHSSSSTQPVTQHKVDDASSKAPKVVDRHDDARETVVGVRSGVSEGMHHLERPLHTVHGPEKVFVAHDTAENSLIVTCALPFSMFATLLSAQNVPKRMNAIWQTTIIASCKGSPRLNMWTFIFPGLEGFTQKICR
jgi:hypothetical protein